MAGLGRAARELGGKLEPVTVEYGVAREERVTYNRRGRRPDGSAYFIREEDRLLLDKDYIGTIDPDATVVVLRGRRRQTRRGPWLCSPGTPSAPIIRRSWSPLANGPRWPARNSRPIWAGVPVAFLQGCCGDINSKYMLTGTIEQARQLGEYLGDSYIAATKTLQVSKRTDLQWTRAKVDIPHGPLPPLDSLEKDLVSIDDFIRRGRAGDENTLFLRGYEFPEEPDPALPRQARRDGPPLVYLGRRPAEDRRGREAAKGRCRSRWSWRASAMSVMSAWPFEPFVRIGLRIKRDTPLPVVLTSGYTDGSYGYIPDASACNDREYMGGFFRYLPQRSPYAAPAGDAVGDVSVPILKRFAEAGKTVISRSGPGHGHAGDPAGPA
jgi:hypothetical protein